MILFVRNLSSENIFSYLKKSVSKCLLAVLMGPISAVLKIYVPVLKILNILKEILNLVNYLL